MAYYLAWLYQTIPQDILNVVYITQLGYLRSEDRDHVSRVPDDWVKVFQTSTTVSRILQREISEEKEYGDLYHLMTDYEMSQDMFTLDETESAVGVYRLERKDEASQTVVNGLSK
jgi:hypothetical protein